jgi:hypothetical protein
MVQINSSWDLGCTSGLQDGRNFLPGKHLFSFLNTRLFCICSMFSLRLHRVSDIPGDPGSQLPYQEFSPYYLAPI